jgi:Leucine-rich repeat (LRR) protein
MELNQNDISSFKFLTDLSVSGNNIEILKSNLFEHNHHLKHIDFTRNRLKNIGSTILKPLNKLAFADFYQNDCVSEGSKFSFDILSKNLREKCKPTAEMMLEDRLFAPRSRKS